MLIKYANVITLQFVVFKSLKSHRYYTLNINKMSAPQSYPRIIIVSIKFNITTA